MTLIPSRTGTTALALLAALALPVSAQNKPADAGKKLYCWNQGGERICSDTLPSEAVNSAREEFNARSGTRSAEVQRALTAEERADAALARAQAEVDAAAVETRKRTEQAMLSTYGSEDALRRVFNERVAIVDNNIKTAAYNVTSLREALAAQLASAGNKELAGQKVADKQAQDIRQRHGELLAQLRLQGAFEAQRRALDVEIAQTLARYRELKGITAPADAPPAPAAAPAPAQG
ncbi:hypothetical protein ATCM_02170 [Stenotrophomonas sp. ATCM1_4]|jgi:hypothetical protein|uniref:Secreted protein n=1 Tax=Stenotrophomonas capsici TaxID=3110230 RepID=A0ABU5V7Y2_9GAMM|nr:MULTISPECIES: hypothetical protein [unclassified Stenotrophomonas]MEA5669454.1 hypothetical protein [Stenotrophomonas sp. MH1]TDB26558.1 hypothetical protein ATCM_02170 [Stenotrophomonas sp. ATCM1_4]